MGSRNLGGMTTEKNVEMQVCSDVVAAAKKEVGVDSSLGFGIRFSDAVHWDFSLISEQSQRTITTSTQIKPR